MREKTARCICQWLEKREKVIDWTWPANWTWPGEKQEQRGGVRKTEDKERIKSVHSQRSRIIRKMKGCRKRNMSWRRLQGLGGEKSWEDPGCHYGIWNVKQLFWYWRSLGQHALWYAKWPFLPFDCDKGNGSFCRFLRNADLFNCQNWENSFFVLDR